MKDYCSTTTSWNLFFERVQRTVAVRTVYKNFRDEIFPCLTPQPKTSKIGNHFTPVIYERFLHDGKAWKLKFGTKWQKVAKMFNDE